MLVLSESHKIAAGSQFTGALPTYEHAYRKGMLIHREGIAGGLFNLPVAMNEDQSLVLPAVAKRSRRVVGVRIKFGGQTSWSLSVVDVYGDETVWLSGTTETKLMDVTPVLLTAEENLKLVSAGATTAMIATINFEVGSQQDV